MLAETLLVRVSHRECVHVLDCCLFVHSECVYTLIVTYTNDQRTGDLYQGICTRTSS